MFSQSSILPHNGFNNLFPAVQETNQFMEVGWLKKKNEMHGDGSGTCRAKTISYQVISSGTTRPIFFVRVISYHFPSHRVPFFKICYNSIVVILYYIVSKFNVHMIIITDHYCNSFIYLSIET